MTTAQNVVSTLEELAAEAPDFIKLAQDMGAATQAYERAGGGLTGIIAGARLVVAAEADIVKVYNDVKALGVAQAIASGAVTPAAPSETPSPESNQS